MLFIKISSFMRKFGKKRGIFESRMRGIIRYKLTYFKMTGWQQQEKKAKEDLKNFMLKRCEQLYIESLIKATWEKLRKFKKQMIRGL